MRRENVLVLSFYSPSVAREIRDFVINSIYEQLINLGEDLPQFQIVGGDTNNVFSNLDKTGGNLNLKHEAINAFDNILLPERVFSLEHKMFAKVN